MPSVDKGKPKWASCQAAARLWLLSNQQFKINISISQASRLPALLSSTASCKHQRLESGYPLCRVCCTCEQYSGTAAHCTYLMGWSLASLGFKSKAKETGRTWCDPVLKAQWHSKSTLQGDIFRGDGGVEILIVLFIYLNLKIQQNRMSEQPPWNITSA